MYKKLNQSIRDGNKNKYRAHFHSVEYIPPKKRIFLINQLKEDHNGGFIR